MTGGGRANRLLLVVMSVSFPMPAVQTISAFSIPTGNIGCCSELGYTIPLRSQQYDASYSILSLPAPSDHRSQRRMTHRLQSTQWGTDSDDRHMIITKSDDNIETTAPTTNSIGNKPNNDDSSSTLQRVLDDVPFSYLFRGEEGRKKLPPLQVDDTNVLLYDVFLIVNLSLSISFWVTHRVDFAFIPIALSEGCLFSLLWIGAGLYHGSFLYSAMDGHYPPDDESGRGGPLAAAALAFNTYINAINLRLVAALLGALIQHRQVGMDPMEELIPLEVGCGLVLMTLWRALHSSYTPRM
jgi:hypothetical protein